jgi:serine protein kinase
MTVGSNFIGQLSIETKEAFQKSQSILSLGDYLEKVYEKPRWHLRNCAQYFCDMIDEFGAYEISGPKAKLLRYSLFDAEFAEGTGRVFGQERVQEAIVSHLRNFVRSGKVDKLLLLHGPNGSSKTSLVQALARAAEHYSKTMPGAIYQFSWVFPKKEAVSGNLGFGTSSVKDAKSFATLDDEALDSRILCDMRDHPLMLFSKDARAKLIGDLQQSEALEGYKIPQNLHLGDLSHRNRQIFDTLLSFYHGDLEQVFRHVRVERFYFSRRYRKGISVVEPQLSVDANVRQLTNDQSLFSLPSALRNLSLYEVSGALSEGNRGLIEYSDLLKRPIDAWKYLLEACENAQVGAQVLAIYLDAVLIATSNEAHLSGFKEYPDWASFKGRIELIRVPYLLRSVEEEGIYHQQISKALNTTHIAPHAIELAARWAVLTRLEPPRVGNYPASMQEIVRDLSPTEKLEFYNTGVTPAHLTQKQAMELKALLPQMYAEYANEQNYEGRFGASPREILVLLLNAAQDTRFDHLGVGAVFTAIEKLIEQKSSFDFLRREPERGFRDAAGLLLTVKDYYRASLEDEVRNALQIYDKESYLTLFKRYVLHVSAWTKKERLIDPLWGRAVDADAQFMQQIEARLLAPQETPNEFRQQLIAHIASAKLDHPQEELDYAELFKHHLRKIKDQIYVEQKSQVSKVVLTLLRYWEHGKHGIDEKDLNLALILHEGFIANGYTESSAKWALAFFVGGGDGSGRECQPKLQFPT